MRICGMFNERLKPFRKGIIFLIVISQLDLLVLLSAFYFTVYHIPETNG